MSIIRHLFIDGICSLVAGRQDRSLLFLCFALVDTCSCCMPHGVQAVTNLETLEIIGKLLYNAATQPKEDKYRRIRLTSEQGYALAYAAMLLGNLT
jgi:hypothetical protein